MRALRLFFYKRTRRWLFAVPLPKSTGGDLSSGRFLLGVGIVLPDGSCHGGCVCDPGFGGYYCELDISLCGGHGTLNPTNNSCSVSISLESAWSAYYSLVQYQAL